MAQAAGLPGADALLSFLRARIDLDDCCPCSSRGIQPPARDGLGQSRGVPTSTSATLELATKNALEQRDAVALYFGGVFIVGPASVSYSEATAAWLSRVLASPTAADVQRLTELARDPEHPLGAVVHGFARLFDELHRGGGKPLPIEQSLLSVHAAAATLRAGAARLVGITLEVLPPLRVLPHACIAEAVEAALFEAVSPTLTPLLAAAVPSDSAFNLLVDRLASRLDVLPDRLGLPRPWCDRTRLARAVDAASRIAFSITPRAKLECFLDVCDALAGAEDRLCTDDLIPACVYALVAAKLHGLPQELFFIKLFVTDEDELRGRTGFGLATLEAATSFLASVAMFERGGDAEHADLLFAAI